MESKKKLIIVSQFFYPYSSTSTPKVITELAEDLVENGLEVEVITTKLSYNSPQIKDLPNKEERKGVKITRIWSTLGDKNSAIFRILNYLTFIISLFLNLVKRSDYDCMLILSNPPIAPIVGHLISKIKKKKYVYLIHDLYPDIAVKLGVIKENSIISNIMNYINKKVFRSAHQIVVLGRDMEEILIKKGVKPEKIRIITNWADSKTIYPTQKENKFSIQYKIVDTFNIVYTGNIGRFHDMETLVECARELKDRQDIRFIIIGEGYKKKKIVKLKEQYKLDNLIILGYQEDEIYNDVLNSANLLVSSLEDGVEGLAVPSKSYSYIAAGKPIIAIMNSKSEIARVVREHNIGICIENKNVEKLKAFISSISKDDCEYNRMVNRTKKIFYELYSRQNVTTDFYINIKENC